MFNALTVVRKQQNSVENAKTTIFLLYTLTNVTGGDQIEKQKMGGSCRIHMRYRNAYKIVFVEPKGKEQLGRARNGWDNIKIHLREI